MREIWAADCETDPFKAGRIPQPFIWGCYNGSEYHEFNSTDDFLDFISSRECIVYAHNGGKFDWHYCLHRLTAFDPIMVIAGRLAKFNIGSAEMRDSYNIIPIPLKAWNKDDFDYTILEPDQRDKPENKKKISAYLKSDCVNLFDMISNYIDRYGLNLTQAGAAMKTWQKMSEIKVPETGQSFYDEFAPYYYGGRVECFESGMIEHDFKVIDINSAYPFAMKHRHAWGVATSVSDELPNSRAYTERSFIKLIGVSRGALPYRDKNGLTFPNDDYYREYHVTGWEFLAAVETRALEDWRILSVTRFLDSVEFNDYVDHFYKMKSEAKEQNDNASYIFAKLFLNSLYGKFAANPEKYDEYMVVSPRYIEAAEQDGYGFNAEIGNWALVSKPLDEEKHRFYNVATAASITGFVRAYLWRALKAVKTPLYCDTDSIACYDTGDLELDPEKLGAWDVEAVCDRGAIAGKKLYAFHDKDKDKWKTASKGVRLNHEEIIKVAKGDIVTHTPENPSYSIKRGIKFISRKIQKSA